MMTYWSLCFVVFTLLGLLPSIIFSKLALLFFNKSDAFIIVAFDLTSSTKTCSGVSTDVSRFLPFIGLYEYMSLDLEVDDLKYKIISIIKLDKNK